ncbi:MAG: EAL domain-containing protein [Candidatus Nanopelagicales bacterium]
MQAGLSRARYPAVFVLGWTGSVVFGWGLAVLAVIQLRHLTELPPEYLPPLLTLATLVFIAELRPLVMTQIEGDPISISGAFIFAVLYIWGPWPALVLVAGAVMISELVARMAAWKLAFNVGQYTLSVAAACVVLALGDWWPQSGPRPPSELSVLDLGLVALAWLAFHMVNLALVACAAPDQSWWDSFTEEFWFYTTSAFAVLALSPLVAVVAVASAHSWVLLPLLLVPLLALERQSQLSQEREHRAMHDPLTGLPNRLLLARRIEAALDRVPRPGQHPGQHPVVLLLDLDSFKHVNDGLGHSVGDTLLVDVADRLNAIVRSGDTLARFSGDEFAVVCQSLRDNEVESLVEAIRTALARPFRVGELDISVTASIGVAPATPGATAQSMLREADAAMHRAKEAGRDQAARFRQEMQHAATARLDDQLGLRRALERDELRAYFQPVVDLRTGEPVGLEALIRWQHPERGLIGPDQFIGLAEETGLILPVGAWMLDHALSTLQRWRREIPGTRDLWVAVNLSARQLTDPDLLHKVSRALAETGVPAGQLHLEITETAVMRSHEVSTATLDALRQLGVHLIIDDFGTGYSSLSRLKRLPVTTLKVDRSFVDGLGKETSDLSIVDAIIKMAESLGLEVIAEGVETRTQLEILHSLGVRWGQGYLWSRPLPAAAVSTWLAPSVATTRTSRPGPRAEIGALGSWTAPSTVSDETPDEAPSGLRTLIW